MDGFPSSHPLPIKRPLHLHPPDLLPIPQLMRREYDGIMMENLKHPVETCRNWVSPWPFFTNQSKGSSGNDSPWFHGLPDPSPCYPSFACSLSPGCPCSSPTPKQLEGNGSQRIWIMDGPSHLQDILVEIFDVVACFNLSWKTLVTSVWDPKQHRNNIEPEKHACKAQLWSLFQEIHPISSPRMSPGARTCSVFVHRIVGQMHRPFVQTWDSHNPVRIDQRFPNDYDQIPWPTLDPSQKKIVGWWYLLHLRYVSIYNKRLVCTRPSSRFTQ
jgi:hypothetical protein